MLVTVHCAAERRKKWKVTMQWNHQTHARQEIARGLSDCMRGEIFGRFRGVELSLPNRGERPKTNHSMACEGDLLYPWEYFSC